MIYIKNELNVWQNITFSEYITQIQSNPILRLTNKLDGKVTEFNIYNFRASKPYINIELKLHQLMTDGEYDYTLVNNDGNVVCFGLAVVGEYKRDTQSYIKDNKKIQYKG